MCVYYPKSKVEVKGFIAKHYDRLMNIVTFGRYSSMIERAVQLMDIKKDDRILDLGAGTGRNACLMAKYLSLKGELVGLDISEEMRSQFKKNCADFPNLRITNERIDKELVYENYFDKVFISFALHGFPQKVRKQIIKNAFKALKKDGEFFILDYNEFLIEKMPFYVRIFFKLIECPYAFDFIKRNLPETLASEGFSRFEKYSFFSGYLRLLKATKKM